MITRDILCENHTQFPVFDKTEKFDDNKIVILKWTQMLQ